MTDEHLTRGARLCLETMTDKDVKKIYNSRQWKIKRLDVLSRDRFECQDCKKRLKDASAEGIRLTGDDARIRPAVEVHHIKELKDYPELAFNDDNLISLCTQCHNLRHGRELPRRKKKKLVSQEWW